MSDEIYVLNENGQIEINFDSLLLITSEEFVERVKFELSLTEINNSILDLKQFNDDFSFTLFIKTNKWLYHFDYSFLTTRITVREFNIKLLEVMGFEYVGK